MNELAIQPVQQFAYTVRKNATDASMIIDAMDLLYSGRLDAFAIVSSDSDFTRLASRIKESEIFVFGIGDKKTPVSFMNACDDFIYTENLGDEDVLGDRSEKELPLSNEEKELLHLIVAGWKKHQNDEGWANIAAVGSFIKRSKKDFDPRTYGHSKVTEVISNFYSLFEVKKFQGKGNTYIAAYRPKTEE